MYTLICGLLMAAQPAPAIATDRLTLLTDYDEARDIVNQDHKPMMVMIGTGDHDWDQILTNGSIGQAALDILREHFVCLYVDSDTSDGKKLAQMMGVPAAPGLIITNRKGNLQALRYRGKLNDADLQRVLTKYGDPGFVVYTTDTDIRPPIPAPPPRPMYTPTSLHYCPT